MPFGSVFAALFFGAVCTLIAAGLIGHTTFAGKLAGLSLALLGLSLTWGLLTRRSWARWGGVACAAVAAILGARLVSESGTVLDHLLLLAAVATAVLLALPATGAPRGARHAGFRLGAVELCAAFGFVGLTAAAMGAGATGPARPAAERALAATPASSPPSSLQGTAAVRWTDFESGMAEARATGKPVLATFVTSWCPYCTKMRQKTWRAPEVLERLSSTIPVRVDTEDPGQGGPELGDRYGIQGYPVQILLDPAGKVLARADGYQTPDQLLDWLDDALAGTRR